ncbi:hypothetical protein [Ramlibacter rhizophilus]|uniref:Uncharacterized protein n=1 Tax=Ramlibacter rhizophilus TaxID=1781167 RepID=A0A4Z0BRA7_9BURK|nr:hypothetical protein [Ramlibacter rhizophilus]TFZ01361.1 hypothetical protein EZ242_08255 [Ramlibacter rhizophilus]
MRDDSRGLRVRRLHKELEDLLRPHVATVRALEVEAGIQDEADRLRAAVLDADSPHGIRAERAGPIDFEALYAREADRARSAIRDLYFDIPERGLRRQLLDEHRRLDEVRASHGRDELQQAARELQRATRAARYPGWVPGVSVGGLAYVLGSQFAPPLPVALGALGLGLGLAWMVGRRLLAELARAQATYHYLHRDKRLRDLYPLTFSWEEANTGLRDRLCDGQSAYENLKRFLEMERQREERSEC